MKCTSAESCVDESELIMEDKNNTDGLGTFGTFDDIQNNGYEMDAKDLRSRSTLQQSRLDNFIKEKNICMKVKEEDDVVKKTTNCYGGIEFKDTTNRSTGRFIRFSDDTEPEHLYGLLTELWGIDPPKLLISVTGGAKTLDIPLSLKNDFQNGLSNIANTPGAWVISGGTNTGVMKMVGDANFGRKNTCIGIATWGVVAKRETLDRQHVSSETQEDPNVFPYHLGSYLFESGVFLDANHSHFLLVDDGSENNYGSEIEFRGRFEQYIMTSVEGCAGTRIPTVLLVLEGGPGTLNTVLNTAVSNNIPCVLIEGSGRAADLLVYALQNCQEIQECEEAKHEGLLEEVRKINKNFTEEQLSEHYDIVLKCLDGKNVFTVANFEEGMDTDDAVLTALLQNRSNRLSHSQQLQLAILWDRVDLAQTKILSPMSRWEPVEGYEAKQELDNLMIMALALQRTDFVRVLLDYGVSIRRLLTTQVLEFLYWYCSSSLMKVDIISEPIDPWEDEDGFLYSLLSYMGSTDKKEVMKIPLKEVRKKLFEVLYNLPRSHVVNILEIPEETGTFKNPFRQLFIWAVLNNLVDMALLFSEYVDDGIALALLAAEISNGLTNDARFSLLPDEEEQKIRNSFSTFSQLSLELLDECYKVSETNTGLLITNRLKLFNQRACCVEFAFMTKQMEFVAHTAVQSILNNIWYGSIKSCEIPAVKVLATIFCPLFLINIQIQNQEQMTKAYGVEAGQLEEGDEDDEQDNLLLAIQEEETGLSFVEKMYNFHVHSPLVRFFEHTLGYLVFLMLFSYVAMCEITTTTPGVWESLVIATVIGYFVAEIYQVIHVDGSASAKTRLQGYFWDIWNLFDCLCIIVFILAVTLRCFEGTMDKGQLLYAVDVSLWWIRLIQIMYAHQTTGPYVVMIGAMLSDMFSFLIILLIFLISYGVAWHAILEPGQPNSQMFVQSIFKPYFNIYGEYFIDAPDDGSNTTWFGTERRNAYAEPIAFIYMAIYLLIGQVLLLNLLIAIFGNTFGNVMVSSSLIWKYERFSLIMEYSERRTFLCPPFSLLSHIAFFVHWIVSMCIRCVPSPKIEYGLQLQAVGRSKRKQLHELENNCTLQVIRMRKEKTE